MQTTADRISMRMGELKLQHKDLVAATGASKGTVTNWISGVNEPTGKRLLALAVALQTTPNWILTGNGEISSTNTTAISQEFGNVRPSGKVLRRIPVLDFVQAGMWREVAYDGLHPKGETYTTYEGINPKAVFSLTVDGMSMAPEFLPGDEIVVDAAKLPVPGSLVVAQEIQQGSALTTFKKYRVIGINEHGVDIVELVPLNPDYPTYNSMQIEISIIGVVVQHHREFKY